MEIRDFIEAGITLAVALIAALFIRVFFLGFVHRLTRRTSITLDDLLSRALRGPLVLAVVLFGVYLALLRLSLLAGYEDALRTAVVIGGVVVGIVAVNRLANVLLSWYDAELAPQVQTTFGLGSLPVIRRFLGLLVYGLGIFIVLDLLDINISPLIAGLGIGGLAVALAAQPTLSNLFAGAYVATDGAIREGDYIELEGSLAGYVVNIGWRTTKIRTPYNNLVILPNTRLADSTIINYYRPTQDMYAIVNCGVSYDSDLQRVEQVALEVARDVLNTTEGAVPEEPWFGFTGFGDSNINFFLWFHVRDRIASFSVPSEMIKRLHARFAQEGIEINYPVRKLVLPQESAAPFDEHGRSASP